MLADDVDRIAAFVARFLIARQNDPQRRFFESQRYEGFDDVERHDDAALAFGDARAVDFIAFDAEEFAVPAAAGVYRVVMR